MRFPPGSVVVYRQEAWLVVGYRAHTRTLESIDGRRTIHEPADRLRPAP